MRKGKEYIYWEARYTEGVDPGTGKQIQRSIISKTQKEVGQKLKAATTAIDSGTYIAPTRITVSANGLANGSGIILSMSETQLPTSMHNRYGSI